MIGGMAGDDLFLNFVYDVSTPYCSSLRVLLGVGTWGRWVGFGRRFCRFNLVMVLLTADNKKKNRKIKIHEL